MSDKKVIVITGAGTGLGRAFARGLAQEGHAVVVLGRRLEKVQAVADEIGGSALALACDVTHPDSVRDAFAAVQAKHGHIDVLINNAAVFSPFLLEEATDTAIKSMIDTNLLGPVLCSRAAIPLLRAAGRSLIVNISSESVDIDLPWLILYETTKAGLERLSRGLRQEFHNDGVRVTTLRVGSLSDPDKQWDVDPKILGRFFQATIAAGFNLREKPSSKLESVTKLMSAIIALPEDTATDLITLSSYKNH